MVGGIQIAESLDNLRLFTLVAKSLMVGGSGIHGNGKNASALLAGNV
jgi:hypothetical protein